MEKVSKKEKVGLRELIIVSMFSVIAFLLMYVRMPVFFAPSFMDVDISEMPALIASFSFGPLLGFVVVLIKIVLKTLLQGTTTAYVGELSNLIVSSVFVVTAGLIYKKNKTLKSAIIALAVGVVSMSIVATLSNYFVIFPLYGKLMGIPLEAFAEPVKEFNPLVNSYFSLMLFAVVPFNLLKGLITSIFTFILYKKTNKIIRR